MPISKWKWKPQTLCYIHTSKFIIDRYVLKKVHTLCNQTRRKCTLVPWRDLLIKAEKHSRFIKTEAMLINSVGSEPKLGSARLGFGSSFWGKKLGSPCLPKSSARLAISCKKSSVQLGLLYDLKNKVTLKTKNELISNFFANFYRYNPEDINKSVFFPLKSCIL